MNPFLLLALFMVAFVGNIALNFYLGNKASRALKKWRNNSARATLLGRVATGYVFWSLLGSFMMCAAILLTMVHFSISFALMGFMCFPLMVASELEPARKICKTCGN